MPRASKRQRRLQSLRRELENNLAVRVLLDSSSDEDGSLADDLDLVNAALLDEFQALQSRRYTSRDHYRRPKSSRLEDAANDAPDAAVQTEDKDFDEGADDDESEEEGQDGASATRQSERPFDSVSDDDAEAEITSIPTKGSRSRSSTASARSSISSISSSTSPITVRAKKGRRSKADSDELFGRQQAGTVQILEGRKRLAIELKRELLEEQRRHNQVMEEQERAKIEMAMAIQEQERAKNEIELALQKANTLKAIKTNLKDTLTGNEARHMFPHLAEFLKDEDFKKD